MLHELVYFAKRMAMMLINTSKCLLGNDTGWMTVGIKGGCGD